MLANHKKAGNIVKIFTKFAKNPQIIELLKNFSIFIFNDPSAAKMVLDRSMLNLRQTIFGKTISGKILCKSFKPLINH